MAIRIVNRSLDIPISERNIGHTGDNLVEVRIFELNRYYSNIDLSEFNFKLDTQVGDIKNIIDLDKAISGDKIVLTWLIKESHLTAPGRMDIQIRAFKDSEEKWHSAKDYVNIQSSINASAAIPDPLPSEFEQMEQRVTVMKTQAEASAQTATEQANRAQSVADEFEVTTLPAAITAVGAAVDEQVDIAASHADRAQGIADTFSNTTLPAAISAVEAAGQAKVDLAEQQADRVEDIIQEAEQDVLPELRQAIEDGIETKEQLGGSIQEAGEAKTALDGSISSAGTAKGELDGSISSAGIAKTQLDGSISSANGIKSQLDGSITAAGQAKELLDESIQTGDLATFKAEVESFKNDFTTLNTEVVEARQGASNLVTNINFIKSRINAIDPFAIFGVAWDKSSNPTLTRTDAAVGLVANVGIDDEVVQNDFDRVQIFGEIHDVEDSLGNVFVRIPKFYIRKTDTPTQKTWQISKTKHKGFYLPWCFWDFENHRELPYIDFGKYKASLSLDNRLESKPDVPPLVNRNIVQFREYAQNNNVDGLKGYQQLDVHAYDVLQTLFYVEFATLNSQSIMQGFTAGRYGVETEVATVSETDTNRIIVSNTTAAQYRVGQTISVGTARYGTQVFYGRTITAIENHDADNKAIVFDGAPVNIEVGNLLQNTGAVSGFSSKILASSGSIGNNSDGKYPCMYRGIESPYGDIYQFVDGININDLQAWVALNANDYASNVFASPYKELGYLNGPATGFIKEMGFDSRYPFAELPIEIGADASTFYSDYYYQNTGQRIARVGGSWTYGSTAGLAFWDLHNASSSTAVRIGGRLLRKPL